MQLHAIDYAIIAVYFVFVLGIGAALRRFVRTSLDFFESGRSLAAWITGLAFLSANLGAQEVIGMAASGAKYGIMTSHFYMWMGRMATVFGTLASIATAYVAMMFGNIMDLLQLVFSFINAPLFATFLLGMFWARTTANGAFWGLLAGTGSAAVHYALTGVGEDARGGLHAYPSDMAQNFWGAIYAWTACFVVTIAISLVRTPRKREDLKGLVYSLTPRLREEGLAWYRRPAVLAIVVGALTLVLNVYFW